MPSPRSFAEVALPVPLRETLVYSVPDELTERARPGVRVRVPLGRRDATGWLVDLTDTPPADVQVRPILAVLDLEPVLSPEILELARFTADYYIAPLGEVLRAAVPSGMVAWGERRVWLTDRGALAPTRDALEAAVQETLRDGARRRLSDLESTVQPGSDLQTALRRMEADGWIGISDALRSAKGTSTAVELVPGDLEDLLARCGRSEPARAVVRHLHELGRPASVGETLGNIGCGRGVVRRLEKLGVLRSFQQIERVDLGREAMTTSSLPIELRPDQSHAVDRIVAALDAGRYAPFLLTGITGSGKTEVYLRAALHCLEAERSVILLVPEIALVPALADQVRRRVGARSAILHSALRRSERHREWERIRSGEARIVLGPRSAIFAPVQRLGLIVVDEEQDGSFKQDTTPRYNGRDLAYVRARGAAATAIFASATPSLETRHNLARGKLTGVELTERVGTGGLPEGVLIDLRNEGRPTRPGEVTISERLRSELERVVAAGQQAVLLRNRRGYAPMLLCRACGENFPCDDCGLARTLHRRDRSLLCHYCGDRIAEPARCPSCDEPALDPIGSGTERVEESLRELLPGVAIDILDRDIARQPGGAAAVLERFAHGETQVLVGTQMVSKGHHFPNVALAAVLLADSYLGFPDFRAVERTYSMLVQLAGRAGRGDVPGRVVVQTYHPDHYAIQAALQHDDAAFLDSEMRFRRMFHYPPYTRMVQLLVQHPKRASAENRARELGAEIEARRGDLPLRVNGPVPAPFERLKGRWRFQLLLRAERGALLRQLVADIVPQASSREIQIDVDPYDIL